MGSMSASDAAPLPRLGEVFFDVRGTSRTMRVSWYTDTEVAVFSVWNGDTCTGTFRLPREDLPRMIEVLSQGLPGETVSAPRSAGAPTTAMTPPGLPADEREHGADPEHPGWSYGEPRERYEGASPAGYDAGYDAPEPFEQPRAGYPPSGPLPVGRWQAAEPDQHHVRGERDDMSRARQPDDAYPGRERDEAYPPRERDEAYPPRERNEAYPPREPDGRYFPGGPASGYPPDEPAGYAPEPARGYAPGYAPGYAADDYVPAEPAGEYRAEDYRGEPANEYPPDPLAMDYHDEAEQGYLPGPPTDTFPATPPADPHGHGADDRWEREYGRSRSRS
jgi:hypothetical protein